jgi:hypothetical protein
VSEIETVDIERVCMREWRKSERQNRERERVREKTHSEERRENIERVRRQSRESVCV